MIKLFYYLVGPTIIIPGRPVERGERQENIPGPPALMGASGGPLGFELQTKVHKNKLFISVLSVLLISVGPYWSWLVLGFRQIRFMDITALPEL